MTPLALLGAQRSSIDNAGFVGQATSLAVVNGHPAVSYYNGATNHVMYVQASDVDGATWGTPLSVDSAQWSFIGNTSLVVANGNPAISYYEAQLKDLKYVRATDTIWCQLGDTRND